METVLTLAVQTAEVDLTAFVEARSEQNGLELVRKMRSEDAVAVLTLRLFCASDAAASVDH